MLDGTALDALWICTPPRTHVAPAVAALDAGLPLYLEKPIARSLADAEQIVTAAARGTTVCTVGYQWRAIEVLGELHRALAGQTVGCLVGQSVGGTESRPWFLDQAAGEATCWNAAATTSISPGCSPARSSRSRPPGRRSGWPRAWPA